ncbi:hypothetical protein [Tardiphaga sp. 709]|uniref:hypothetical protein n=1 Tax=Tardiphaga sp. 709 TaxID=3076039 RepID=UPI0028EC260B|nr:hypothetical protein [Tardiphaga sp. 709]WNV10161.1 hypothetical protein RSO67_02910 [Tardiphaga sp. 709]
MITASTVTEIHTACSAGFIPVNVDLPCAIAAHRQHPGIMTLRTIIMAAPATVEEERQRLDYLAGLPEEAWIRDEGWWKYRDAVLDGFRRVIAWRSICA